jgi:hypothetical protein
MTTASEEESVGVGPRHRSFGAQSYHYFHRDHTSRPQAPVQSTAAWLGRDMLSRESDWRLQFTTEDIAELDACLDVLERDGFALNQVDRQTGPLPGLATRIELWRRELTTGRGFIVLTGLPVERWGEARSGLAFWLLGHHLGVPGAQNVDGELLGHVVDYGEQTRSPNVRLYRTRANIGFHCDAADVVGLLCLQSAARGGDSRIASSVAIWNALFEEDHESALSLFDTWALDRRDEQPPDQPGHLDLRPCRLGADGQLRTFYHSEYFRSAARLPAVGPLSEERLATLDRYDAIGHADPFHLDMQLEPGDVQLISNHTIVHARTGYEDSATRKRHLLRLWLSIDDR